MIDKKKWIQLHRRYLDVFMKMSLSDKMSVYPRLVITDKSADSFNDSENNLIQVGIADKEYDKEEDLMLYTLYVLGHEVQHVRSTSHKAWMYGLTVGYQEVVKAIYDSLSGPKRFFRQKEDYDNFLNELPTIAGFTVSPNAVMKIVHFVMNSLEDGRIERIRSNVRVDFKNQRTIIRGQTWKDNVVTKEEIENINNPRTYLIVILNEVLMLATTRLFMQDFVEAAAASPKLHSKIQELMPYIKKGIMSASCRGCMDNAIEIIKALALEIIEACKMTPLEEILSALCVVFAEEENHGARSDQEETSEDDEGGAPLGMDAFGDDKDELEKSGKSGKKEKKEDKAGKDEGGYNNGEESSNDSEDTGTPGNSMEKDPTGDSIMLGVNDAMEQAKGDIEEDINLATEARDINIHVSRMPESQSSEPDELPDITDVGANYGYNVDFKEIMRDYPIDEQMPIDIYGPAKKLKKKVEKILHNQETPELRSQKAGILDSHDLAKLAMNQLDIYMKPAQDIEFDGCAYILMDDSASMGDYEGSKRWYCISAVAQIEEAFSSLMPVKIMAFEAKDSESVYHHCIKNWHEKTRYNATYNFFVHVPIGSGNKDGYSIRVATKELLAQSAKKKILVVLSDGLPSDYPTNNEAYSDVHDAVNKARKSGIEVISIYFGANLKDDARDVILFREMYGEQFSLIAEPENLGNELTKIMKNFSFRR